MNASIPKTASVLLLCAAACAHAAPKELVDARAAWRHASAGPTEALAPADLHKASVALDQAERAFRDEPTAQRTSDLAYVAERKAQLAEASALLIQHNRNKAAAEEAFSARQARDQRETKEQLLRAQENLVVGGRQHERDTDKLNLERVARIDAELKAASAEQKTASAEQKSSDAEAKSAELEGRLTQLAAFKAEERGLVLTLSGSVLFTSDQATLLPAAESRLDQIAEALLSSGERSLLVEGYTDARGQDAHNLALSQRRADSVRSYIVSRGYPGERIRASGEGKRRPIASNGSAEGRANNRRVEIIILPK